MQKIKIVSLLSLLVLSFLLIAPTINAVKCDSRSSYIYGSTYSEFQTEEETEACIDACAEIEYYFSQIENYDYVENYYDVDDAPFLDNIESSESNCDFATVLYKGHSMFLECPYPASHYHYFIYDNDGDWWIFDSDVGCYYPELHNFVFMWSCGTANEVGG